MRALAELLLGLGWRVSGSDTARAGGAVRFLVQRGLEFHEGHSDEHVPAETDVVVHSQAVDPTNPELRHAASLGVPRKSYSRMLGWLMQDRVGVCVSGTHGKSTTTAMTASILVAAGRSPSAVVGAELCGLLDEAVPASRLRRDAGHDVGAQHGLGAGRDRADRTGSGSGGPRNLLPGRCGWSGEGELMVVEACEYRRSFLDLSPTHAAILGIEPDHFDYFTGPADVRDAFAAFARQVVPGGNLVVRSDCPISLDCARESDARIVTFSDQDPTADFWVADVRTDAVGTRFRLFHEGTFATEVRLRVPGRHNALNATAAAALCRSLGVPTETIRDALGAFLGVRRRFEIVGTWRGITLVDDYAHHPSAVRATLRAARERFGDRCLRVAFQPHQISRTRALFDEFAACFEEADEILVAPAYAARESCADEAGTIAQELAEAMARRGCSARAVESLDRVVASVDDEARPGDVLITMGAGDIERVHHEFTGRLQRRHAVR